MGSATKEPGSVSSTDREERKGVSVDFLPARLDAPELQPCELEVFGEHIQALGQFVPRQTQRFTPGLYAVSSGRHIAARIKI
jgi:hypothetical protein